MSSTHFFPMVLVVQALSIGFLGGGQMCEALLGGLLAQGTTEATDGRCRRGEEFAADVLMMIWYNMV